METRISYIDITIARAGWVLVSLHPFLIREVTNKPGCTRDSESNRPTIHNGGSRICEVGWVPSRVWSACSRGRTRRVVVLGHINSCVQRAIRLIEVAVKTDSGNI